MTVGAVSLYQYNSNYNYDTTDQYRFFGTLIPDDQLNRLMVKYGIIQTSDPYKNLHNLYISMEKAAKAEATSAAKAAANNPKNLPVQTTKPSEITQAQAASNIPWATLMGQIGLSVTGILGTDYAAFKNKIATMQASATTQAQKANIGLLIAQAQIVFVDNSQTTQSSAKSASFQAQPQTQKTQASQVTGADIQAQLNKLYMNV